MRCSGCSPLGGKSLWNRTIAVYAQSPTRVEVWWRGRKSHQNGTELPSCHWNSPNIQVAIWNHDGPASEPISGLILGLRPASEKQRYLATTSLIGWGASLESALNIPIWDQKSPSLGPLHRHWRFSYSRNTLRPRERKVWPFCGWRFQINHNKRRWLYFDLMSSEICSLRSN